MTTHTISKIINTLENTQQIGKKIKILRQLKGLSQSDIAIHLGITFQQLQKYESGKNKIPVSKFIKIADALGVDIAVFFEDKMEINFNDF